MRQKLIDALEKHWFSLFLAMCLTIALIYIHIEAKNREQANLDSVSKALVDRDKVIMDSIGKVDVKIKEINIKSTSDSIIQYETIKKQPVFKSDLSHIRLLAIRDSIRKSSK